MADEPEKRIEEPLRAYARKRREDAGAPMELHPANRRLLQAEVAKLRAAQTPERRSLWQSMLLVWPRFAAAVGMFAVLAVGVWVFTQSEGQRANEAASTSVSADGSRGEDLVMLKDGEQGVEAGQAKPADSPTALDGKKLADSRSLDRLDKAKREVRDAEPPAAPTMPAPARPPVVREKQEARESTPAPAQQPVSLGVALQNAEEKRMPEALKKQTEDRYYRADATAARPAPDSQLGYAINTPITAGVSLAASKPVELFFYQEAPTNLPLLANGLQLAPRFDATNSHPVAAYGVSVDAALPFGPAVAANERAANQQVLSRSEMNRAQGVPFAEESAMDGEAFERQDIAPQPAVLQRFELYQQPNGRLSIRDADGSLYEGQVLEAKADLDASAKSKVEADELALSQNRRLAVRLEDSLAGRTGGAVRFRASGTNRNKELVVINGEILAEAEQLGRVGTAGKNVGESTRPAPTAAPSGQAAAAGSKEQVGRAAADRQITAPFAERAAGITNSAVVTRATAIRGRVQVGRTNQQEFRAIRSSRGR